MALFESYERRIDKINSVLNSYGIASIEEAEKITKDAGLDVYNQIKGIQPICFENACWAYIVGAAIAIKKDCRRAADAAAAIGEGLQAFCIPGSVADTRKVGLGHGNLGKMLLEEETDCFCFLAGHESFAAAEGAIGIAEKANKVRQKPLRVILNGLGKDAAKIISRINGFTYVQTEYDYYTGELKEVQKHRDITRAKREKNKVPVVAIVGYTNAGKSTLLNHLTEADVLEEDKLFATLDPTTRILALDGKQQVLLTDTVGFIRKLPHHLIEAFKSTLEEAKYADIIFHVVDASNMQREKQMFITYQTLDDLGVKDKKFVTLFNKQDARTDNEPLHDFRADYTLNISAAKDLGLDEVKSLLEEILRENKVYIERIIPYDKAGVIQLIRKQGELVSEEYVADGIQIKAYVPMEVYGRLD